MYCSSFNPVLFRANRSGSLAQYLLEIELPDGHSTDLPQAAEGGLGQVSTGGSIDATDGSACLGQDPGTGEHILGGGLAAHLADPASVLPGARCDHNRGSVLSDRSWGKRDCCRHGGPPLPPVGRDYGPPDR